MITENDYIKREEKRLKEFYKYLNMCSEKDDEIFYTPYSETQMWLSMKLYDKIMNKLNKIERRISSIEKSKGSNKKSRNHK